MSTKSTTPMECPKMVSPEEFAVLRRCLERSNFTESSVQQRLGLKSAEELDLSTLADYPPSDRKPADTLDAVILLFILGEFLETTEAVSLFSEKIWDVLIETRLVSLEREVTKRCFATVALYPIRDLYVASDRWNNPDRTPAQSFPDVVYPALTRGAQEFLRLTPFERCEDFLEICAGSAAAGLLAARLARHVWVTDIAERSTRFASFNAALNGIENVTILLGDLYEPVKGRTFDRITAHPPYMPVLEPAEIYYGGGEDGEGVTRRIIADLPIYLCPGGRLYCRTLGTDRPGKPFEQRVRKWLGRKEAEFDVSLIVSHSIEPRQFALEECVRKHGGSKEMERWKKLFAEHEIENIVTGMVVIQRIAHSRPVFTIRRTIRKGTPPAKVESLLRWETELQEEGFTAKLLRERPLASPTIRLTVLHRMQEGELTPAELTVSVEEPFAMDCKVQPWMALLLSRSDGMTTAEELFSISKENGWIVPATPEVEFCRLLGVMISGGFLKLENFKWSAEAE